MVYEINILSRKERNKGVLISWNVIDYSPEGTIICTNFNTLDEDFINMRLQMLAENIYG